MDRYTICCVGFDGQQMDSISAIVDLASSALSDEWSFFDEGDTDVVMFNMNSDSGKQAFLSYKDRLPEYRIILAAESSNESMEDFWFLTKKAMSPPSLRELTDLFNQIGLFLAQLSEAKEDEVVEPVQPETEPETTSVIDDSATELSEKDARKLEAKNYLFGLILQAEKDKYCRMIQFKDFPLLYVSPEENYYCFNGTDSDLNVLCLNFPKHCKVKKVSQTKLSKEEAKETSLLRKPLSEIKAQAIILASQGRILDGHSPQFDVKLTTMPAFESLPILAKYLKMAEYMLGNSMNLFSVAENLHISLSDVFDFYNVCYLFGIIEVDYQSAKQKKYENKNAKTLTSFLKSLFKKK